MNPGFLWAAVLLPIAERLQQVSAPPRVSRETKRPSTPWHQYNKRVCEPLIFTPLLEVPELVQKRHGPLLRQSCCGLCSSVVVVVSESELRKMIQYF